MSLSQISPTSFIADQPLERRCRGYDRRHKAHWTHLGNENQLAQLSDWILIMVGWKLQILHIAS